MRISEQLCRQPAFLNKAVSRNLDRFPGDFMFRLTKDEFDNLKFQSGTSSWGGIRKLPRVFTEQGVAMLSSVLRSTRAVQVNVEIIRCSELGVSWESAGRQSWEVAAHGKWREPGPCSPTFGCNTLAGTGANLHVPSV